MINADLEVVHNEQVRELYTQGTHLEHDKIIVHTTPARRCANHVDTAVNYQVGTLGML